MTHEMGIVAVAALVTAALRFAPFLIFGRAGHTPKVLQYLSGVLPAAVMAMLVVYCLRNVQPLVGSHGIPELLGVALVALTYLWRRNTLLSIVAGTVLYMVLVQMVFV